VDHLPVDASPNPEPIRLFKSDFLEFFTHISPVTIVVIWLPVSLALLYYPISSAVSPDSWTFIPGAFLLGLFIWTFSEYTLHRFLFHFPASTPRAQRISFLFHGIHHAQPQVKTRLVMPLPVSIPMSFIFFGLFHLVFGVALKSPAWVAPVMGGFLIGYLAYDLIHYATHHLPMRSRFAKYLKRHHMQHHYKDPATRFGVSSPAWDYVFATQGEQ
jgi:dihydroceramide fatty acyl 2-hydroxylase